MSSNINPNNIDGTYPVAGQDNNSQGFRDNFTNTKTNFQYAATEINDLQSKGIFKAALTGTTLDNDMLGSNLSNAQIQDFSMTRVALGTLTGSVGIDYSAGHYQTVTTGGSISLAFTNFSAAGTLSFVTVRVTVSNVAHTLTLPVAVGSGSSFASVNSIQGFVSNVITFNATGTFEFHFHTDDGGSTVYISELTRPRNRFTNPIFLASSEDVAATAAISLTRAASFFTTAAGETATLAAGLTGQVKVLAAVDVTAGNMVVTVTNPAWAGAGTITFNTRGQACTLQYINSLWFCTGNNGAVFA